MMKKLNRVLVSALALTIVGGCMLGGCGMGGAPGGGATSEKVDEGKSQLYVDNYAGGFGSNWLNSVKARFEADYAETSFESGKKGVQVMINHNKNQGETYINQVDTKQEEVYFPGNIYYHTWVKSGKMLDITDVVSEVNAEEGESILNKMSDKAKAYYSVDGKYYAIPHHNSVPGLVYDVQLFEDESLYFAKDGAPSEAGYAGTVKYTGTGAKSAGPDGKYDTEDDGLPATYDEFFTLCDYMIKPQKGITPFIWIGANKVQYTNMLLTALMTDYEGVEQTELAHTYAGTATNLVKEVKADGTVVMDEATEINDENGYKVYHNAGRYYALSFLERILDNPKYMDTVCTSSTPLTETHEAYIYSVESSERNRIAFMSEGNWWENETTGSFKKMADNLGEDYAKNNRKFAFMPLPKATKDKVGEEMTYAVSEVTLGFIKASIKPEKVNLAKTFLKYCYTDEALNDYTAKVGLPAALDYEIDETVYNSLSYYGKQQCNMKDENLVKPYSTNSIYNINNAQLRLEATFSAKDDAITELLKGTSAATHFNNLCTTRFTAEQWKSYL